MTGWLLDRWRPHHVVLGVFLFPTIACVILATFNGSLVLAVIAMLCTAVAAGAECDMLAYFTSRYFVSQAAISVCSTRQIYGLLLGLFSVGYASFPAGSSSESSVPTASPSACAGPS